MYFHGQAYFSSILTSYIGVTATKKAVFTPSYQKQYAAASRVSSML
jgi:hypothetical protein